MPHPVDVHVGAMVRALRTAQGMSQSKLAELIGVSFPQVQKYEKGTNRISVSTLYMISRVLSVPPGYFFEELPEMEDATPPAPVQLKSARAARLLEEIPEPHLKMRLYGLIKALSSVQRVEDGEHKSH